MLRNEYMKKFLLSIFLLSFPLFASTSIGLGFGPYHGLIGIERSFVNDKLSLNVHIPNYDSDYGFLGGVGVAYHFTGITGTYVYHSSEWIHSDGFSFEKEEINYWSLAFGFGYQHCFFEHLCAYFEMGFAFYAGNGGYYTNFKQSNGTLDDDELSFPSGLGAKFVF